MKKKILFLCTGNSCRSQMAEGWLRHLKSDVFDGASAGIECHGVNHRAVKVMAEEGVDISGQSSTLIDDVDLTSIEYIVTVCDHAQESCPVVPPQCKVVHTGFQDPPKLAESFTAEEEILDCYRGVRDKIKAYIETLPDSLAEKGNQR